MGQEDYAKDGQWSREIGRHLENVSGAIRCIK